MKNEGYLLAQDSLRGTAGTAFMEVDGENVLLFGLKKFESDAELSLIHILTSLKLERAF